MTHISTIRIAMAISAQIAPLALSALPRFPAENVKKYYTVQILAAPVENKQAMLSVYESLRDKGCFAYYYPKRVGDRQYLRLRTGIFESPAQARAHAADLRKNEGFDSFITEAEVTVTRFKNQFSIVTAPSGIWLVTDASANELYTPVRGQIDRRHTAPQIAPDGTAIVFYAGGRIVKVQLGMGQTQVLQETVSDAGLLNSIVRWSPDGQCLAYLDAVEWELPTKLWIMRTDGTENRRLIGDETGRTKVKSFFWHPRRNRVFYVVGPTHGTVSLGGSLCSVDLDGARRMIAEASPGDGTEVLSDFRIAGGLLYYRIVRHGPDGKEPQYSFHELALSDLD